MRKKSKYKPKGVRLDNLTWVISGMKPFAEVSLGVDIRIKNHVAMDQLRKGEATKEEMDILIGAFNMMEGFVRLGIGTDWSEEIREGQDALLAVARRGVQRNMRFVATGPELTALNLAMEVHDAQLDVATVRELEKALDIVTEDVIHKRARAINEDSTGTRGTLAEAVSAEQARARNIEAEASAQSIAAKAAKAQAGAKGKAATSAQTT